MPASKLPAKVDSWITPWPASVGGAAVAAAIFVALRSSVVAQAIGPLIALALLALVDFVLGMRVLQQRPVSVHPIRQVAVSPEPVRLIVSALVGSGPIRVHVRRLEMRDKDSDFVTLDRDDTSVELMMPTGVSTTVGHVRCRVDATVFGLVWARRWSVHSTPEIHRGPGPVADVDLDVRGVDDLSRLRGYVPGDRMAHVAWGATARTGQLHVRSPMIDEDEVTIVVDAGPDVHATMAGRPLIAVVGELAASVGVEYLQAGRSVNLVVREHEPAQIEHYRNEARAHPRRRGSADLEQRRFSLASATSVASTATAASTVVRSGRVYDADELIARLARLSHGPTVDRPPAPYIEVCHAGAQSVS